MREKAAAAIQLSGLAACVGAGLTVSIGLGLAVAGIGLILFGVAVERG